MALTGKRRLFVVEYAVDQNATKAAIRAGYSPNSAGQAGGRLLKDVEIAVAIAAQTEKRIAKTLERVQIDADWVIMQQAAIYQQTATTEPEVARKTLVDIGDGIGMYVERHEVSVSDLTPDQRLDRLGSIFQAARQRKAAELPA